MKPLKTAYRESEAYRTKDGSLIRELMHPARHGCKNLSFAEAIVEPGCATMSHIHTRSEEIYHVARGSGLMTLGKECFAIGPGDTVCIRPNTLHRVENTGGEPLVIHCCCAPPYSHEETIMCAEMR